MQIETRQVSLPLSDALRTFIDHRVGATLRRHIDRVARVVVRLNDVSGPRHGADDKVCKIQLDLDSKACLVAEGKSHDIYLAVRDAALRLGHAVDRRLGKQRKTH
jgi:ribosomal subunit interface protein